MNADRDFRWRTAMAGALARTWPLGPWFVWYRSRPENPLQPAFGGRRHGSNRSRPRPPAAFILWQ